MFAGLEKIRSGNSRTVSDPVLFTGPASVPVHKVVTHGGENAQSGRVAGRPNRGRVVGSKRVMAEMRVPDRVRTISPTV